MNFHRQRQNGFRKPTRTKVGQKIALMQCILARDSFTDSDIESLARCFGHSEADVRVMVDEELQRRESRAVQP